MSGKETIAALYDAFARGDIEAVLGGMDSDVHWYEAEGNPYMPSGEPWVGPDEILNNLFVRLGDDWDEFQVHPRASHDAGDVVVVEARYVGRHAETQKSLDCQVCHVWTLKNGKVAKFQQYVDTAQLQDVMGA